MELGPMYEKETVNYFKDFLICSSEEGIIVIKLFNYDFYITKSENKLYFLVIMRRNFF